MYVLSILTGDMEYYEPYVIVRSYATAKKLLDKIKFFHPNILISLDFVFLFMMNHLMLIDYA